MKSHIFIGCLQLTQPFFVDSQLHIWESKHKVCNSELNESKLNYFDSNKKNQRQENVQGWKIIILPNVGLLNVIKLYDSNLLCTLYILRSAFCYQQ